ncbi:oligosaccharide flippase family protein [Stenotrophomonas hibiscicola]|uniref:oligosaccharide flippase family protein n=1 Tax=Stenotrophomonas hibiscicola TaxID=86189 RepID=UPI00037DCF0D|nr:oligosaccharide flippase family protein [[Pseudomonas] hibiscicola]
MNRSVKHASVIGLFTLAGAGLAFFTQMLAARVLGPREYGIFMAAFTTINIVSPLTAFGLQAFWLKAFGREGWHAMRWIRPTFVFCLLSTVLTMLGVVAWALLGLGMEDRVAWCLLILSTNLLSVASIEVVTTRFLLEEKPLPLMVWQTLPQVVRFLVVVGVLMATTAPDAVTVAWLYAFVGGGLALASVPSMMTLARGRMHMVGHQKPGAISLDVRPGVLAVAKETWAFGLGNLFFLVYFQSSVIFISHYLGAEATGTFGVAVTLLAALYLLPTTIYQKLLMPRLHRWAYQDPVAFRGAYHAGNKYMLLLGLAAAVCTALLAQFLVPLLFGKLYEQAAWLLAWLAPCIPMRFVSTSAGAVLSTGDRMRIKIRIMGLVAVLNLVMNFLFIGWAGLRGAVVAAIATEALLMGLYLFTANRSLRMDAQA